MLKIVLCDKVSRLLAFLFVNFLYAKAFKALSYLLLILCNLTKCNKNSFIPDVKHCVNCLPSFMWKFRFPFMSKNKVLNKSKLILSHVFKIGQRMYSYLTQIICFRKAKQLKHIILRYGSVSNVLLSQQHPFVRWYVDKKILIRNALCYNNNNSNSNINIKNNINVH